MSVCKLYLFIVCSLVCDEVFLGCTRARIANLQLLAWMLWLRTRAVLGGEHGACQTVREVLDSLLIRKEVSCLQEKPTHSFISTLLSVSLLPIICDFGQTWDPRTVATWCQRRSETSSNYLENIRDLSRGPWHALQHQNNRSRYLIKHVY